MPSPKDGRGRMLEACHREQGVPRERATLLARFKKIKKKQTHMHTDTQSLSKGCTMSLGQSYIYKLIYKFKHQSPEMAQWGKVLSATLMT